MQARTGAHGRDGGKNTVVSMIDGRVAELHFWVESGRHAGACAAPGSAGRREGRHCTCGSNRYAGSGCGRASQSSTVSASPSSHAGGPRAGPIAGGSAGSPIGVSMRPTRAASVMKATMRIFAQRFGPLSGNNSSRRASRIAPGSETPSTRAWLSPPFAAPAPQAN